MNKDKIMKALKENDISFENNVPINSIELSSFNYEDYICFINDTNIGFYFVFGDKILISTFYYYSNSKTSELEFNYKKVTTRNVSINREVTSIGDKSDPFDVIVEMFDLKNLVLSKNGYDQSFVLELDEINKEFLFKFSSLEYFKLKKLLKLNSENFNMRELMLDYYNYKKGGKLGINL